MLNQFSRTQLLLGKEAMDKLANSRVAVFGIGGVGGYVCEALVRSGVGAFDLIDDDKVCLTNLNRQIIATRKTVGKYKTDVMKERMLDILGTECDFIQAEIYKNSHFLGKRNDKVLYYDCSNYYFEIEQEDGSKKYGKSKEHRPNPIIQMGLFMDGLGTQSRITAINEFLTSEIPKYFLF